MPNHQILAGYVTGQCSITHYVTGSWKTYLLGTSKTFGKSQMKMSIIFFKFIFFAHLDKATIKPSCCEVFHPQFLFLGDVDDYIRPCSDFTLGH